MKISEEYIETNDLDWYASDENGHIHHFTTTGTDLIPEPIITSFEAYKKIFNFFSTVNVTSAVKVIENNLPDFSANNITTFNKTEARSWYLESFCASAAKGIFSYDIDIQKRVYFLVAKPIHPLSINDCPEFVQKNIFKIFDTSRAENKYIRIELT